MTDDQDDQDFYDFLDIFDILEVYRGDRMGQIFNIAVDIADTATHGGTFAFSQKRKFLCETYFRGKFCAKEEQNLFPVSTSQSAISKP